jgi:S-adenosylmethionine decarboxylase
VSLHSLFQSGMDLGVRGTTRTEDFIADRVTDTARQVEDRLDHFIERDGQRCAGVHLIIDLYGAERLDDPDHVEAALRRCVDASGATLLHIHLHHFSPDGVSGVAVLAESHISVHTWPENGYGAFDVFMCGDARPEACVAVLGEAFSAQRVEVRELLRGTEA